MSIVPQTKNPITILNEFILNLESKTGLTNFEQNSKIRVIVDTLVQELSSYLQEQKNAFRSIQKSVATNEALESLGLDYGKQKFLSSRAFAVAAERNIAFYVVSGVFGDINSDSDITIPKGTLIYSIENQNDLSKRIDYVTTDESVLDKDSSIAFVNVEASVVGSVANIGKGVLRRHNFTSYTNSAQDTLKVTNFFPILNGQDRESEESFRNKLLSYFDSLFSANKSALQLSALTIPGAKNTIISPNYFGIGNTAVLVQGTERETNSRMLDSVQAELNTLKPPGVKYTVLPCVESNIYLTLQIELKISLSQAQKEQFELALKASLNEYFKNRPLGVTLSKKDLLAFINTVLASKGVIAKNSLIKKMEFTKNYGGPTAIKEILETDLLTLDPIEFCRFNSVVVEYI